MSTDSVIGGADESTNMGVGRDENSGDEREEMVSERIVVEELDKEPDSEEGGIVDSWTVEL